MMEFEYLQVSDDGVLYVFLLFLQEEVGHRIQGVGAQFVVSQQHLHRRIGGGLKQRQTCQHTPRTHMDSEHLIGYCTMYR